MRTAVWAHRHARSILFLLVTLIAGGVLAARGLPVSLFPHVNFPRIRVNLDAGDRPAEQMELQVTRPIELALRGIPGARGVTSTTSRGSAEVSLTFDWGQDMASAALQAQAAVNRAMSTLPRGTTFDLRRMDPTVFPVIAYSLTSQTRATDALRDLARYRLAPVLSEVPGVTKVDVVGGEVAEIHVTINPARLAERGLALGDVSAALAAANTLAASGRIEDRSRLYLVVTDAQLRSLEELRNLPIRAAAEGLTRLGQIADVRYATAPRTTYSTADGRQCVLINVFQQPDGNTVEIAAGIRSMLAAEQQRLPKDVTISCWYDQSDLINASAAGVRDAVMIGVALAALVLLLFLRDWRMTLIATLAVPVVLGITSLLLYLLGESFNIMTLGGMAAAVGLIIDDAIVMSEHIVRRLRAPHEPAPIDGGDGGGGDDVATRVRSATDEFIRPLAGSSLSTIVIHIPPAFLVGVFGAFFAALSLAMAASLVISFLVAWLVIPVVASRLLRRAKPAAEGMIARRAARAYTATMRAMLRRPWLVLVVIVPLLAGGLVAFQHVESGLMPVTDEGGFVVDYVGPPGAAIPEMNRLLGHVERAIAEMAEVQTYSRRTGFSLGGDISESNTGDFFVRLKPLPRRPIHEVMDELAKRVGKEVPGLRIEPLLLMEDLLGDLSGQPQPVVVHLFGDDTQTLVDLAPKVAASLATIKGLSSIENGVIPAGDAIQVRIDSAKAAREGFSTANLATAVTDLLSGNVATQVQQGERSLGVRVWTPSGGRDRPEALARLNLRAPDGHLVPLSRVATLEHRPGQPEITRQDLQRVVSITARSSRDLGSTIRDVRAGLDRGGLIPKNIRYTLGGLYEQQQAAFRGTAGVILAAAALVFALLLFLYERLRVALAILFTSALAVAAVFVGLRLTGTELNISSMMGMVMIVGNVTEAAIFYYSELIELPPSADANQRLILAGANRMRAITMTTAAAILALLPLAIDYGGTAGMLRPLAMAIITGLVVQLPLVLVVLPVLLGISQTAPVRLARLPGD